MPFDWKLIFKVIIEMRMLIVFIMLIFVLFLVLVVLCVLITIRSLLAMLIPLQPEILFPVFSLGLVC